MYLAANPKKMKWTVLLSVNAVAVIIAGILIANAIRGSGMNFRLVNERSDVLAAAIEEPNLIDSTYNGEAISDRTSANYNYVAETKDTSGAISVPDGELWQTNTMTIYATPDADICVGEGISDLGEMYWQTSNPKVISGFYDSARTWLGYNNEGCRFPVVKGTGTTIITAGTYDGKRKDSIAVTVLEPPVDQWKKEVLSFVNNIRANNGLSPLSWSTTCEKAANIRANEIKENYSHTRPDGTSWSTACPVPESGGTNGENLAVGNAAVSPVSTVMLWMSSESHRDNILNPDFTKMSVGFVYDSDSQYKTYWTQIFSDY